MPDLAQYSHLIQAAATKYGIPVGLLERQIMAESGGNQDAKSPVGAIGLMQLMPQTAKGLGVNPNNPGENIMGGAKYLRDQYNHFGNWRDALAAYNAGPAAVSRFGGVPPYAETRDYVSKILSGGLPSVGAAPRESQPALPASAGMSVGAPTHLPNYMDLAQKFAGEASDLSTTPGMDQPSTVSNLGSLDWRQFLPKAQKMNTPQSLQADIPIEHGPLPGAEGPRFGVNLGAADHMPIVQAAKGYLGVPYKWGGTSRQGGMDCSGFLQNVMRDVGVKIGRTTYEQVKEGQPVSVRALQPGDAVFTEPGHAGPNHVGLYVGHGMIQESPHTGTVNSYIPLKNFLGGGFVAARRYTGMLPEAKPKK